MNETICPCDFQHVRSCIPSHCYETLLGGVLFCRSSLLKGSALFALCCRLRGVTETASHLALNPL